MPKKSFIHQKRTISTSKPEISSLFGSFLPFWIRIRTQPTKMNADPDPQHWFFAGFLEATDELSRIRIRYPVNGSKDPNSLQMSRIRNTGSKGFGPEFGGANSSASPAESPGTTSYESPGFTLYGYDLLNMSLRVAGRDREHGARGGGPRRDRQDQQGAGRGNQSGRGTIRPA